MIVKNSALAFSTYLFFVMCYIEDTVPYGQILTFFTLAMMLVITLQSKRTIKIPVSGYIVYILVMLLFCLCSTLWAQSPSRTTTVVRGLLMTLIIMTVVYACNYQKTSLEDYLKIVMYGGYTVVIYSLLRYGWSTVMNALTNDLRLSNSALMNSNTLGMCAAYAVVVNIYYILYRKIKISDLLMIPSLVIIAASGSRKSIIIIVAGFLMLVLLKNYKKENFAKNLGKGILGVAAAVLVIYGLSKLPIFSNVISRLTALSNVSRNYRGIIASDIRGVYNIIGLDLFKSHPILGIGIHNASLYISQYYGHPHLHNNFIELLACGGIVGFLVHYSFYFFLFYSFWKFRKKRNSEYDIFLVLLVIRFVMGYGHIQYFQVTNYFYLMVFYLFVKKLQTKDENLIGDANYEHN